MIIELVGTFTSVGSFLFDARSFRLAVKENLTKIDSIFITAEDQLMEAGVVMNEYSRFSDEKERENFYEEYEVYVQPLGFIHDHELICL